MLRISGCDFASGGSRLPGVPHAGRAREGPSTRSRALVVLSLRLRSDLQRVTATLWQGTHHGCCLIVRILQGIAQGVPTRHLAQELGLDRKHLLERRHQIQTLAEQACPREALVDAVVEADEMDQNAGEKGRLHSDPEDHPTASSRQPSTVPGTLTGLPSCRIVGRDSGQIQLKFKKTVRDRIWSRRSCQKPRKERPSTLTSGAPTDTCRR